MTCTVFMTDAEAIARTCREMGLPEPTRGKVKMFDGKQIADAYSVQLPGWDYVVAIDAKTGEASYDNYGGSWGEQKHLDRFTQLYDTNAATIAAESLGYQVEREYLANGYIQLAVTGYH